MHLNNTDSALLRAIHKVPGCDVSGIIEKVGAKVKNIKVGDEVYGVTVDLLDLGLNKPVLLKATSV